MSDAYWVGSAQSKETVKDVCIWQRDEILLILRCTDRCLPIEDITKFIDFLETALPASRVIRFTSISSITRQLDQLVKSNLVDRRGVCYRITMDGSRIADEAELMIEEDWQFVGIWDAARKTLVNLPSSRFLWDSYLYSSLNQINGKQHD